MSKFWRTQTWRPVKGKSFTYRNGLSFFIMCILKLLPLQGALLNAIVPRALPWAKSFCPFYYICTWKNKEVKIFISANYC